MSEQEKYDWMVYVSCMTFNHAPYIVDALNGFTMQETDFPFVCAIVDDASTDGEQEVLKNYLNEHFDLEDKKIARHEETDDYILIFARHKTNYNCHFAVLFLKYNHYSIKKSKAPYIAQWREKAKYIALCEGDDYWIAPVKLQKQVEFLESHPEVGLVHARAKIFNQERRAFHGVCGNQNGDFEQILLRNPIVTLTTCYRTSLYQVYIKEAADWNTNNWKMGDYPMWIWMSKQAGVHFLDEIVAVYREQNKSVTHSGGLDNKLTFIDSTVDIRLFFCNLYKLPNQMRLEIIYNANLSKAANCLARREKKKAEIYLKKLSNFDRWNLKIRFWFHDVRKILKK